MRVRVEPGGRLAGEVRVPGDKSIAHRWLLLAVSALGPCTLLEVPTSLDVRSTAACLAAVAPHARRALQAWARNDTGLREGHRSTWNVRVEGEAPGWSTHAVEVEGEGRRALCEAAGPLRCGNSGTSMRLLMGLLATTGFRTVLTGDSSLSSRPMERVAEPLRALGARIATIDGHAPITIDGGPLRGTVVAPSVPSAQIKSAVLFAGLDADGTTTVRESVPTRDHTERALQALGAPIERIDGSIAVRRFQHEGFSARVPGDPSSAAFLVAAAALTGSVIEIVEVGLNPTRTHFLEVMARMGVETELEVRHEEMGEPVGDILVRPTSSVHAVQVEPGELPLVIDEVPVLAGLAAHAPAASRFLGAGELRVKESDRLRGLAEGIRTMGGQAAVEGEDLVVTGGGLEGGVAEARGDHRMAMAFAVSGLAARAPVDVEGMESADVSFPGFIQTLDALGASIQVVGAR